MTSLPSVRRRSSLPLPVSRIVPGGSCSPRKGLEGNWPGRLRRISPFHSAIVAPAIAAVAGVEIGFCPWGTAIPAAIQKITRKKKKERTGVRFNYATHYKLSESPAILFEKFVLH